MKMAKKRRPVHLSRDDINMIWCIGSAVASLFCMLAARILAEIHIDILPAVLGVVSSLLWMSFIILFTSNMRHIQSTPCFPAIIASTLLTTQVILGYSTRTTFLIEQNGCQFGDIRLGYPAFMRLLAGGVALCFAYAMLYYFPLRHRRLCAVLKTCALGGSFCAAIPLIYMCLSTRGWLLFPELVVFLVATVSLRRIWKRIQSESKKKKKRPRR